MKENNINNTSEQQTEKETKNKRGRPRKYSSDEERIKALNEKQNGEKRKITQFMKQLREEGRYGQLDLIDKLRKNAYETEYIDWLIKDFPKHEEKKE